MIRYHWTEPAGSPIRVELIDNFTLAQAAVIVGDLAGRWHWSRYTSMARNGAPPINGSSLTLAEAKQLILDGLPDAPNQEA